MKVTTKVHGTHSAVLNHPSTEMSFSEIFKKRITLARVYGIPVRIDYRWFIVVGLSSWLISRNLQSNIVQMGGFQLPAARAGNRLDLGRNHNGRIIYICLRA